MKWRVLSGAGIFVVGIAAQAYRCSLNPHMPREKIAIRAVSRWMSDVVSLSWHPLRASCADYSKSVRRLCDGVGTCQLPNSSGKASNPSNSSEHVKLKPHQVGPKRPFCFRNPYLSVGFRNQKSRPRFRNRDADGGAGQEGCGRAARTEGGTKSWPRVPEALKHRLRQSQQVRVEDAQRL